MTKNDVDNSVKAVKCRTSCGGPGASAPGYLPTPNLPYPTIPVTGTGAGTGTGTRQPPPDRNPEDASTLALQPPGTTKAAVATPPTMDVTNKGGESSSLAIRHLGEFLGDWKWHGGVIGLDGRLYAIPCSGTSVLVVDPMRGTANTFGNVGGTQAYKWNCAAVAADGTIFAMPSHHPSVLAIDPRCRTVSLLGHHHGSGSKWNYAVASPIDGNVYGLPFDASTLLVIDPATRLTKEISGNFGKGKYKWRVGLLAPDGRIFGIPYNAADVLVIDPAAGGSSRLLPLPPSVARQPAKWNGGVIGADGALYGIPCDSSAVLRIDLRTDRIELLGEGLGQGRSKWRNGVLDPRSGRIFGIPFDASGVLVIEPASRMVRVIGALGSQRGKWADGALGSDGRLYACPHTAPAVLVIDPSTLTIELVEDVLARDLSPPLGSKMCGKYVECLPCQGAVVGVPVHASSVMLITPAHNVDGASTTAPQSHTKLATTACEEVPEPPTTASLAKPSPRRRGRVQHHGFDADMPSMPRHATPREAQKTGGDTPTAQPNISRARVPVRAKVLEGARIGHGDVATDERAWQELRDAITRHLARDDLVRGWEAARRTCVGAARAPLRAAAHRARSASDAVRAGGSVPHHRSCIARLFGALQVAGESDFDGLLQEVASCGQLAHGADGRAGLPIAMAWPLSVTQVATLERARAHRYHGSYKGVAAERDLHRAIMAAKDVRSALAALADSRRQSIAARAEATEAYVCAIDALRAEAARAGELDMDGLLRQAVQLLDAHARDDANISQHVQVDPTPATPHVVAPLTLDTLGKQPPAEGHSEGHSGGGGSRCELSGGGSQSDTQGGGAAGSKGSKGGGRRNRGRGRSGQGNGRGGSTTAPTGRTEAGVPGELRN